VFAPLIDYFRQARERAGISVADINRVTGSKMAGHWFGASQWQLPSEAQYVQLQQLFAAQHHGGRPDAAPLGEPYQGLHHTYHELLDSYDALRAQYEQLRRPFSVTPDVPFTDVWLYPSVQAYPGKHPCEKPLAMMEHIIRTSSRPGDVVADFFMGSGSTGKAAIRLGRRFIGVELETPRYEQTCCEVEALLATTGAARALKTNSDDVTSCPDG
jgi:site-specific DNA-methyltransferase (adenine-specific)